MDVRVTEIINKTLGETVVKKDAKRHEEFSFTLSKLGVDGLKARLSKLIDDIKDQGSRLSKHMSLGEMKHYRTLIASFINEVITNGYEFNRENFLDRRGRHRVYGIVRNIDDELDKLAAELLKSEKDAIKILEKVGEIEGLILDLFV